MAIIISNRDILIGIALYIVSVWCLAVSTKYDVFYLIDHNTHSCLNIFVILQVFFVMEINSLSVNNSN